MRILVLGGTGFVGRALLRHLSQQGHHITVLVRHAERHRDLWLIPQVTLLETVHFSDLQLRKALRGQDAVINLIGILHESKGQTFEQVHVTLVRKLIAACAVEGVARVLHMSALGADLQAPSVYLRSKAQAEALLMASDLDVTIFQPSVIFGEGDRFLALFAKLLAYAPVMPVVCPRAQLSPIWVEDVAQIMVQSLLEKESIGKIYTLCGPRVYSLLELWQLVAEMSKKKTRFFALCDAMSRMTARVLGWLPGSIMTLDNYHSLQVPSVCQSCLPFGHQARSLRSYLMPQRMRERYVKMRQQAGRNQA